MKRIYLMVVLLAVVFTAHAQQRISLFYDHVESITQQKKISFQDAAQKIKDLGYTGIDVPVTIDPAKLQILNNLGFEHACAIAQIDFTKGEQQEQVNQALNFMEANHYDKVLLVPGLMPKNATPQLWKVLAERIASFAAKANARGMEVMLEDYDNPQSPCYNTAALDALFATSSYLGHNFDTGNYTYCNEDVLVTLEHFLPLVHHVHLKDRSATNRAESVAIGTGISNTKETVVRLLATNYKGYFTVEHYGVKDMLACAAISIQNVKQAYEEFGKKYPLPEKMTNGMSEYWTPQPRIVTPASATKDNVPSDAIVLFDGKDLSQWETETGEDAQWIVENGVLTVNKDKGDILTRQKFGSYQLHIEWRIPQGITGESQWRGNSGVFMQDRYEVQILDSYQNETYVNGQAGAIYKQSAPMVNAMVKPGEWNVYDIIYTAPVFREDGTYLLHPYVTVIHNGIVIQNHTQITGTTEWIGFPQVRAHGDAPIRLQSHGDPSAPISFRNIWIRKL